MIIKPFNKKDGDTNYMIIVEFDHEYAQTSFQKVLNNF